MSDAVTPHWPVIEGQGGILRRIPELRRRG
mgnify:CR=1 FL=1